MFNERVPISVLSVEPPPFTGLGRVSLSTSPKSQLAALLVGMDHRPAAPALGSLPPGWQPRAQATQDIQPLTDISRPQPGCQVGVTTQTPAELCLLAQ